MLHCRSLRRMESSTAWEWWQPQRLEPISTDHLDLLGWFPKEFMCTSLPFFLWPAHDTFWVLCTSLCAYDSLNESANCREQGEKATGRMASRDTKPSLEQFSWDGFLDRTKSVGIRRVCWHTHWHSGLSIGAPTECHGLCPPGGSPNESRAELPRRSAWPTPNQAPSCYIISCYARGPRWAKNPSLEAKPSWHSAALWDSHNIF